MSFAVGSFSQGTTGNVSVGGLTFLPSYLRFTISSRSGTNETTVMLSTGFTDGTLNKAHSIFQDTTGARTRYFNDRCVSHLARVSGSITEIIKASWVSFDNNGGGDYGFTLNFTAANSSYPITFEAFA